MGQRSDLQILLQDLLGSDQVYFQPPTNVQMKYPCIVYRRNDHNSLFANNSLYRGNLRYQVTVIDRDPDSVVPRKIQELPMCSYNRFFVADGLNHDVFNLYF